MSLGEKEDSIYHSGTFQESTSQSFPEENTVFYRLRLIFNTSFLQQALSTREARDIHRELSLDMSPIYTSGHRVACSPLVLMLFHQVLSGLFPTKPCYPPESLPHIPV